MSQSINGIEYLVAPTGGGYIMAVNKRRIHQNQIKRTIVYEVLSEGLLQDDTVLSEDYSHFRTGTLSSFQYRGKKKNTFNGIPIPEKIDSIINTYGNQDSILYARKDKKIKDISGACDKTTWFNEKGLKSKELILCGGLFAPPTGINAKKFYEYDDRNRLVTESRYSSKFRLVMNKLAWRKEYRYDQNNNLVEQKVYNEKGKITRHLLYEYEYWQ